MLQITAKPRDAGLKLGLLRADGVVPAVVYGPEKKPISISVAEGDFRRLYRKAGKSTLVELTLPDEKEPTIVIIKAVQKHPVKGSPTHIDLLAVKMGEAMKVDVALVYVGEAPVEKRSEGVVNKELRTIEISALPKNLPHEIEVDVSSLDNVGDHITIGDLKLPEGVEATADQSVLVASATGLREEEEEEEVGLPEGGLPEGEVAAQADEAAESGEEAEESKSEDATDEEAKSEEG